MHLRTVGRIYYGLPQYLHLWRVSKELVSNIAGTLLFSVYSSLDGFLKDTRARAKGCRWDFCVFFVFKASGLGEM